MQASHNRGDTIKLRGRSKDAHTKPLLKDMGGRANHLGMVIAVYMRVFIPEVNNPQPSPKVSRLWMLFRD
jgi:hypothetical protein